MNLHEWLVCANPVELYQVIYIYMSLFVLIKTHFKVISTVVFDSIHYIVLSCFYIVFFLLSSILCKHKEV